MNANLKLLKIVLCLPLVFSFSSGEVTPEIKAVVKRNLGSMNPEGQGLRSRWGQRPQNQRGQQNNSQMSLSMAAYYGQTFRVRELIGQGADVHSGDAYGESSPLVSAIISSSNLRQKTEIMRLIIDAGAGVNDYDNVRDISPLEAFVMEYANNESIGLEAFDLLIEEGAEINSVNPSNGNTMLHIAIALTTADNQHFMLPFIEYLIVEKGGDLDVVNERGLTPRHYLVTVLLNL